MKRKNKNKKQKKFKRVAVVYLFSMLLAFFFFLIISARGGFWSTSSLLSISPLGAQRQVLRMGKTRDAKASLSQ